MHIRNAALSRSMAVLCRPLDGRNARLRRSGSELRGTREETALSSNTPVFLARRLGGQTR